MWIEDRRGTVGLKERRIMAESAPGPVPTYHLGNTARPGVMGIMERQLQKGWNRGQCARPFGWLLFCFSGFVPWKG